MLFNKYLIDITKHYFNILEERRFRNNPKYNLEPIGSLSYIKKDGKFVFVPLTHRWKLIDENKQVEIKKFQINDKIEVNYLTIDDNIYFEYDNISGKKYYTFRKVKITDEIKDLKSLKNNIVNIGKNIRNYYDEDVLKNFNNKNLNVNIDKILIKDFLVNLTNSLALSSDEEKLKYIDDFFFYNKSISSLYKINSTLRDIGEVKINNLSHINIIYLFLSLDNSNILKQDLYRKFLKFLLMKNWLFADDNLSVFETILFYSKEILGNNFIKNILNVDESVFNVPKLKNYNIFPIVKINKDTLIEVLNIMREMKEDAINYFNNKYKLSSEFNLYRGLKIELNKMNEDTLKKLKILYDYYNKNKDDKLIETKIKKLLIDNIKNYNFKFLESWTDNKNIAEYFSGINKNFSEPVINVILSLNLKDNLNYLLYNYKLHEKLIDDVLEITKNDELIGVEEGFLINNEKEYILFKTHNILSFDNIKHFNFKGFKNLS